MRLIYMIEDGITCKVCGDMNLEGVNYYSRCRKCYDWFCEVHINKCANCSDDRKYCRKCLAETPQKCNICNNKVEID